MKGQADFGYTPVTPSSAPAWFVTRYRAGLRAALEAELAAPTLGAACRAELAAMLDVLSDPETN